MYTTTVKTRQILEGKIALKIFVPLIIWLILMATIFFIEVKVTPFALPFMIIIFFTIIPIAYFMRKSTDKFRGEKSFINKEVTFNAINGELYVGNKKMNVKQNKLKTKIYVDDIIEYKGKYGVKTLTATFIGIIEEPYLKDFIKFLNEQGVKI